MALPNAHDVTNLPTGTVGSFDLAKATVVLLHPRFLDSAWLTVQFKDPCLMSGYNLIWMSTSAQAAMIFEKEQEEYVRQAV